MKIHVNSCAAALFLNSQNRRAKKTIDRIALSDGLGLLRSESAQWKVLLPCVL